MNLNTVHSEMSLLGGIIASGLTLDAIEVLEKLPVEAFTNHRNKELFQVLKTMQTHNLDITMVDVSEYIESKKDSLFENSMAELADIMKNWISPARFKSVAKKLRQAMYVRQTLQTLEDAKDMLTSDMLLDDAVNAVSERLAGIKLETDRKLPRSFEDIAKEYPDELEKRQLPSCLNTGFNDLDRVMGRVECDELIILAARPAMGKTELAAAIANHVAKDKSIYIASMEMSDTQIFERLISIEGNYSGSKLKNFFDNDDVDMAKVGASVGEVSSRQGYIQDMTGMTLRDVEQDIEYVKRKTKDLGLIVIDHFGLFDTGSENGNRTQQLGKISRDIKQLAKRVKTPILLLCQLNRSLEARADKRPIMSDLRECGDLEQDANKIMFIYRDEVYNPESPNKGTAEIIFGKNREKSLENCNLTFTNGHFGTFNGVYHEEETKDYSGGYYG